MSAGIGWAFFTSKIRILEKYFCFYSRYFIYCYKFKFFVILYHFYYFTDCKLSVLKIKIEVDKKLIEGEARKMNVHLLT